jgi:predicted RNA-binding Zn-ribbon protein involved in translation (DUF1610 family)
MTSPLPDTVLNCTQCGGELHPDEGQIFLSCPYCGATVFLDKSRVVFHWYLAPTINETQAREALARWMAGSQTVKDLDKKSQVVSQAFQYFPMWYFKRNVQGRDQIELQPAAATSVTELRQLPLSAGDLRKYETSIENQSVQPTVPMEAALGWAGSGLLQAGTATQTGQVLESALVHIPLFTFKYVFNNQNYTAVVEAATGKVLANIYPAKAEAPYLAVGGITAAVFLCLATVPLFFSGSKSGTGVGLLVCAGLGVVVVPLLFALAAWVAAKV